LINSLGNDVGTVLWDGGEQETSADLIKLLKSRHGSDNQCERFRMELKALHRKPGESLQSVYQEVKRLTALAHSKATGKVVETIAIDAFVDALQDRDLRKQILQSNSATLDAALTVAMRIEAIDLTSPPININPRQSYGADGIRMDRAHVRSVTADIDHGYKEIKRDHQDSEYYRAQAALHVNEAYPGPVGYQNYSNQYAVISENQGFQNRQPFYAPQQANRVNFTPPHQQYAQQGENGLPSPQFRPRDRGSRLPRDQVQCYHCNIFGHYKSECPYLVTQPQAQDQDQGGAGANANAVHYAQQQQQQNTNWQQGQYAQNNYAHQSCMTQVNAPQAQFQDPGPQRPQAPQCSHGFPPEGINELNSRARGVRWSRAAPATYIEITIAGGKHLCLMDSGCDFSLIPRRLVPGAILTPVKMDVYAANGSLIRILGEICVKFEIEGMPVQANLLVSDQIDEFTLGYDWLVQHNIIWNFTGEHISFRNKPVCLKTRRESNMASKFHARGRTVIVAKRGRYKNKFQMNIGPRSGASNGTLEQNLAQYQLNLKDYKINENSAGRNEFHIRPEAHARSVQARGLIKSLEPRSPALIGTAEQDLVKNRINSVDSTAQDIPADSVKNWRVKKRKLNESQEPRSFTLFGTAGEDMVSNRIPLVESIVYEIPADPAAVQIRSAELSKKGHHWNVTNFFTLIFSILVRCGLQKLVQFVHLIGAMLVAVAVTLKLVNAYLPDLLHSSKGKTCDHSTKPDVKRIHTEEDSSRHGCNGLKQLSPPSEEVTPPRSKELSANLDFQHTPPLHVPADELLDSRMDYWDTCYDASPDLGNVEELLALPDADWERHCQGSVTSNKIRGRFKYDLGRLTTIQQDASVGSGRLTRTIQN